MNHDEVLSVAKHLIMWSEPVKSHGTIKQGAHGAGSFSFFFQILLEVPQGCCASALSQGCQGGPPCRANTLGGTTDSCTQCFSSEPKSTGETPARVSQGLTRVVAQRSIRMSHGCHIQVLRVTGPPDAVFGSALLTNKV